MATRVNLGARTPPRLVRTLLIALAVVLAGLGTAHAQVSVVPGSSGGAGGGSTATNQTNGAQKTQIVDGSGSVIASTSNNLNVQCANCSGSGASAVDAASMTESTSVFAPAGGYFKTSITPLTTGQQGMVALTANRAFRVTFYNAAGTEMLGQKTTAASIPVALASDATLPVTNAGTFAVQATNTGTFAVQAAQTGTWTVQPGNTANTTPWLVTGSGTAGSAATGVLTVQGIASMTKLLVTPDLPSGASTAAKQPALGTAGSASADVLTVQGIASMTALKVDGSAVTQPVSGTVTASNAAGNVASGATDSGNPVKVGGKYNSTPVTLTDGQRGDAQLDASGYLKVNVAAGSSGNAASSATGSAVPAQADYTGVNVSGTLRGQTAVNPSGTVYAAQGDVASVAGTTTSVNAGASDAGTQRVALSYDGAITLQASQTSGIANTTTTRTTTTGLGSYADLSVLINITGAGAATGTLALYLQDSCDAGTTWNDLVSSNAFTFGAAAATQMFYVSGRLATSGTQGAATQTEALAAGTARQGPFCDRIRVREKVSGIGGSPTGVTYVISAVAKR